MFANEAFRKQGCNIFHAQFGPHGLALGNNKKSLSSNQTTSINGAEFGFWKEIYPAEP
jgi:hypothetical protein